MESPAIVTTMTVLIAPLAWFVLLTAIGRFGGWSQLAEYYAARDDFQGQRWRFESARFKGRANYSSCLTFGADPRGLHISTLFLFRPGHPPLFIPWADITMRRATYFLFPYTELKFRRSPERALMVRERLGQHLAAAAGLPWPLPEKTD